MTGSEPPQNGRSSTGCVGDRLPPLPLFLEPDLYVPTPLEEGYQRAWDEAPGDLHDALGP